MSNIFEGVVPLMALYMLIMIPVMPIYGVYYYFNKEKLNTQSMVEEKVSIVCMDGSAGSPLGVDSWGAELKADIYKDGNGSLHCVVKSAGKDGTFGTDDDITASYQNINKSRIVGGWLKDKGVEVIKGALFGAERAYP